MKKKLLEAIKETLAEKHTTNILVSIECPPIHLQICHELEVSEAEETKETIEIDTSEMCFKIGKNYTALSYDEYEEEYTFKYENSVIITISIL